MRAMGWLVAAALFAHGWLPVFGQVGAVAESAGHQAHRAGAGAGLPLRSAAGSGQERACPVTHDHVCLCAVFAKLLPSAGVSAPAVARAARGARGRFPSGRPPRPRKVLPFDARAPPASG